MKEQFKGSLCLLLATVIWGTAFVAQSVGMDYIGPFTFQAVRSFIAVAALIPITLALEWKHPGDWAGKWAKPGLWKAGCFCGMALFAACGLQQVGLVYADAGKAGFITALYIVLVPVLGTFLGQKPGRRIWFSVALAVLGLYFLSGISNGTMGFGDVCLIGCAVAFAVQIILVDRWGATLDGLRLNAIQFLINAIASTLLMLLLEHPRWDGILACAMPLVYTGVCSSGIAYSLQIIGQKRLPPEPAALIMSLESVVAALAGWLILKEALLPLELLGCALVFSGVILSQLPLKNP